MRLSILQSRNQFKVVYYSLKAVGIQVNLPIIVKTDNIGAMFMAQNASSGVRTRHVDTRYHFVRENLEDGIIKIEFLKSAENDSNIFTKNVSQDVYERHVKKFLEVSHGEFGI